jgi:hypothetical protein
MFIKDIRVEEINTNIDWIVFEDHNLGELQERKENFQLWNNEQKSRYIESLLTIGSISPFVFGNQFSVCPQIVDGFQRYSALIGFIRDEQFSLVGLRYIPAFENKKFSELPRNIQRRFKMVCVKVYVIMPDTLPEYYLDVCRTLNPNIA